jgi:CRISPR-associated endonuclease/helicase Cas3
MTNKKKTYGKTKSGVEITDELIEKYVVDAERGYEPRQLKPRPVGRPPIGAEAAVVFQVRLDPELHRALMKRAGAEGVTPSELARRLLRTQLRAR